MVHIMCITIDPSNRIDQVIHIITTITKSPGEGVINRRPVSGMTYLFWPKIYNLFEKSVTHCRELEVHVIYPWLDHVFICLGKTESANRARKSKTRVVERKKTTSRGAGIVVFFHYINFSCLKKQLILQPLLFRCVTSNLVFFKSFIVLFQIGNFEF